VWGPSGANPTGCGTPVGRTTVCATSQDHLVLLRWAARFGAERQWAVEDCRHLSRRLERDLLAAGESIVRVPPKLMAHVRDSARTYGKSDPIDALAVARAAQREPNLPLARLDGPDREVRLLVDHRESPYIRANPADLPAPVASARTRPGVGAEGSQPRCSTHPR
jgi:hypothetical protein